jgi:DNA polymerase-3 subunit beta
MTLTSGSYTSVINGVEADEFPELPAIDESESVQYSIAAHDFKQAVTQTVVTSSSDATRPVLTGVYWHSVDGALYLAATDGYRLAERRLLETKSEIAAIVPTSSLQEVLRTLSDNVDEVEVLFDNTQVRFRVGEAEITSRLIDGNYPDYRQLIPKESETTVALAADDFARIVKIAGLFARESGGSITLTADAEKQELSIHSIASELGENTSNAAAKITASGQVTLNSRYISEALTVLDGSTIEFRFSGKLSPCVLTVVEKQPNYTHIIMPLKS